MRRPGTPTAGRRWPGGSPSAACPPAHVRVAVSRLTEDPAALDEIADLLAHAAHAGDGMR
ncbi:hypothetical protein AB0910_22165 [Streptomyces sp. NPDC047002]|uniref:hypothetical protein n=1 Tax=Streptomyces sp. NPDC047002 TaxID=3155475 RepID=UPI003453A939